MIKKILLILIILTAKPLLAQEAIQQWVYNMLERAQANIDKGNIEQAEKTYKDT